MIKINLVPINFGEDSIKSIAGEIKGKYKKAMLITGKGSIRSNGLYDALKEQFKLANIELIDFFGIKPNPTSTQINEAAELGITNDVDLIIAAGGGSAIDASKVIATMISNKHITDSWNLVTRKDEFTSTPIDIISIITLAGTASENNAGSVVTNEKLKMKSGTRTRAPILAIEDPKYTLSVSPWQTASGIFDAFSHILEQWFSIKGSFEWTDNYNIGLLKTLLSNGPIVIKDPLNYDARSNILFTTSMALNGLSSFSMPGVDWGVHLICHGIAGIFDTTHGATLALITPTYLRERAKSDQIFNERVLKLGAELFSTSSTEDAILEIEKFIKILSLPAKYSDFDNLSNIENNFDLIIENIGDIHISPKLIRDILGKIKA